LYRDFQQVKDRRKRRGVRYPLVEILMIGILAKLAGQTSSRAIAEWAHLRRHAGNGIPQERQILNA
jgi:hypothetical protein